MTKGFSAKKGFKLTPKDLLNFNETVTKFNTMMGNDLHTTDPVQKAKLQETYRNLSLEEMAGSGELIESFEKGDKEGIMDGLCDLIYTGFAYCTLYGGKCDLTRNEAWVLNSGWKGNLTSEEELPSLFRSMVVDLKADNVYSFQTDLLGLLGFMYNNFDIVKGFARVTDSNFSKMISLADLKCVDTELEIIANAGRYTGLGTRQVGSYMVFTALEDLQEGRKFASPKIIKSSQFKDVAELGGLLEFCK